MKKNTYSNLTDSDLSKKFNLMKSVLAAFAIIYGLAFVILLVLFYRGDFSNVSVVALIPVFMLPITLLPIAINYSLLKAEKKSRNL